MKKLLAILGAIGLTATAGATVVACGNNQKDKDKDVTYDFTIKAENKVEVGSKLEVSIEDFKTKSETMTNWKVVIESNEATKKDTFAEDSKEAASISEINKDGNGKATLTGIAEGTIKFHFVADKKEDTFDEDKEKVADYKSNTLTVDVTKPGDSNKLEFNETNIKNKVTELSKAGKITFKVPQGISKDGSDGKPSPLLTEVKKQMLAILKENKLDGKLDKFSMNEAPNQSQLDENETWVSTDEALLIFKIGEKDSEFRVNAKYTFEMTKENETDINDYLTKELLNLGEVDTNAQALEKAQAVIDSIPQLKGKVKLGEPKNGKISVTANDNSNLTGTAEFTYSLSDQPNPDAKEIFDILKNVDKNIQGWESDERALEQVKTLIAPFLELKDKVLIELKKETKEIVVSANDKSLIGSVTFIYFLTSVEEQFTLKGPSAVEIDEEFELTYENFDNLHEMKLLAMDPTAPGKEIKLDIISLEYGIVKVKALQTGEVWVNLQGKSIKDGSIRTTNTIELTINNTKEEKYFNEAIHYAFTSKQETENNRNEGYMTNTDGTELTYADFFRILGSSHVPDKVFLEDMLYAPVVDYMLGKTDYTKMTPEERAEFEARIHQKILTWSQSNVTLVFAMDKGHGQEPVKTYNREMHRNKTLNKLYAEAMNEFNATESDHTTLAIYAEGFGLIQMTS